MMVHYKTGKAVKMVHYKTGKAVMMVHYMTGKVVMMVNYRIVMLRVVRRVLHNLKKVEASHKTV